MPKQPKEKSVHLQELEAVFDRHTRRFSPFEVLGLRPSEQETAGAHVEEIKENNPHIHINVDATHPRVVSTHDQEGTTPLPVERIHTKVVEVTSNTSTTDVDNPHTHRCG